MKIAIIGTAGRKEDKDRITKEHFIFMVQDAAQRIKDKLEVELISGGAAWADHVTVVLFLMSYVEGLTLYFPADFDGKFIGTDNPKHPANVANYYHRLFSKKCNLDSLRQIQRAIEQGANYEINKKGFRARNLQVGDCDILYAYTFGEGDIPKEGGTRHTWENSRAKYKIHISLDKLL